MAAADDLGLDAMPRFSPMNGAAVFVDVSLVSEAEVVFSAGTHADVIKVRWGDFARTVKPIVGKCAGCRVIASPRTAYQPGNKWPSFSLVFRIL